MSDIWKGWEDAYDDPHVMDEDGAVVPRYQPPVTDPALHRDSELELWLTNTVYGDPRSDEDAVTTLPTFAGFDIAWQEKHAPATLDEVLAAVRSAAEAGMVVEVRIASRHEAVQSMRMRQDRKEIT